MQTRNHINTLQARRSAISDNTTTVANMISQQMHQLFHDPKCFIYEIIQNAEDAEADNIVFKIEKNNEDNTINLVISYNGKPFQEHDIERVCDASRDNDADARAKSNHSEKIGYKGIGFKSVFGISSEITILSPKTDYFFQFSKSYWEAKSKEYLDNHSGETVRFPWQIIPLWLESENYHEISSATDNFNENVTIILKNISDFKIIEELKTFVTLDERLVFLNKIKKIEFVYAEGRYGIQKTQEESLCHISQKVYHAKSEQNNETYWHLHRATVPVEEDITEQLARLDLSSCPEKIKSAKTTDIVFAAKLEKLASGEYSFSLPRDHKLYCYLPTSIDCHLPFLINARFILNQDRSMIINNTWNQFLMKSIAVYHLKWLGCLAVIPAYRNHILHLFSEEKSSKVFPQLQRKLFQERSLDDNIYGHLLSAYEAGVLEARKTIAFIPSKEGSLLCLDDGIIDSTEFFVEIDEKIVDKNLTKNGGSRLIAYDLKNRGALMKSSHEYNFQSLLEMIEIYFSCLGENISHVEIRSKMIIFILKSEQRLAFLEKKIVICANHKFCSPNDSFVLTESRFTLESLAVFHLNIVNLSLYNQRCVKKLTAVLDAVSEKILVKKQIRKLIQHDGINEHNSITILRFIYAACVADNAIYQVLTEFEEGPGHISRFKVLTRDGQWREIRHCFLPLTPEDRKNHKGHQLSPTYFKTEDNDSIWIKLLTCAKIITSTEIAVKSITYGDLSTYFQNSHQQGNLILEYTKHILDQVPNSVIAPVVRKEFKDRLIFLNFIYFPFMFDLNDPNTLNLFLTKLNANYSSFSQAPRITGTKHGNQIDQIEICEHFLTYYFKSNILIQVKGTNQRLLAESLFYLPELLDHFEPEKLPIKLADLPVPINSAAASFLGFRLSITLKEGLKLLSTLNKEISRKRKLEGIDFDRLKAIYRLIIKIDLTKEDVSIIDSWKERHNLLSQAKTFEAATSLKIFDQSLDDGLTCPDTAHWLHDVGLSNHEIRLLAKILHITCYSEDENFSPNISQIPSELISAESLKSFVISLLPALVLIENKEYGINIQEFHKKVFDEINALNFEYCSDITFDNGYKPVNFARILGDNIYFTGRFMHLKVGEILSAIFKSTRTQEWFKEMMALFPQQQKQSVLIHQKLQEKAKLNQGVYDQLSLYQTSKVTPSTFEKKEIQPSQPMFTQKKSSNTSFEPSSSFSSALVEKKESDHKARPQAPQERIVDFDLNSPITQNPCHIKQEKQLRALGNKSVVENNFVTGTVVNHQEHDDESNAEKEAMNKSIGDRGEEIVFRKIIYLLEKEWGVSYENVVIHNQTLGQAASACRFMHGNGTQLDVIWYNRDRQNISVLESPVDIVIAVNGEEKYFIEVKSTNFASNPMFFLTTNEWEYMQQKREKSILVRAYEVDKPKARFEVYSDPFGMICKNLITFMTGGKFRLKIRSSEEAKEHIFKEDPGLECKIS